MKTKPMSNEEFRDRIKAICGPNDPNDNYAMYEADREAKCRARSVIRTPSDRGYHPPSRKRRSIIIGQLCDLSKNGWANAKPCDYEPLERELRGEPKEAA